MHDAQGESWLCVALRYRQTRISNKKKERKERRKVLSTNDSAQNRSRGRTGRCAFGWFRRSCAWRVVRVCVRGGISQQICRGGEYVFQFVVSHTSSPALLSCSSGGSWSFARLSRYRQIEPRERERKIHGCRGESYRVHTIVINRERTNSVFLLGIERRREREREREREKNRGSPLSLEEPRERRNENDAPVSSVTRQLERLFNHVQSARNRRRRRSWAGKQRREPRRLTVGACAEFPWRGEHVH